MKVVRELTTQSHGWRELKHAICEVLVAVLAPLAAVGWYDEAQGAEWDAAIQELYAKVCASGA